MRPFLFELFHASNKNANIGKITQTSFLFAREQPFIRFNLASISKLTLFLRNF